MPEIYYKCKCMPKEATVLVPDRVPGIPLEKWMGVMDQCLSYHHTATNPECRQHATEYVRVDLKGSAGIGEAAEDD